MLTLPLLPIETIGLWAGVPRSLAGRRRDKSAQRSISYCRHTGSLRSSFSGFMFAARVHPDPAKNDGSDPDETDEAGVFAPAGGKRPPDSPRLRARSLHLRDPAFSQPRARQYLRLSDGERSRGPEAHLAIGPWRARSLRCALDPHDPRVLGSLRAAAVPLDAARGGAACPRAHDPVPPGRPFLRHARRAKPVRPGEGLCSGTVQVLGRLPGRRSVAGRAPAHRLDSRLHRSPFLVGAQTVLSAL